MNTKTFLKTNGFIKQNLDDHYILRLRVAGGNLTIDQLNAVSRIAEKYGNGYVHFTTRQGVEIPFIKEEDVEKILADLEESGLESAPLGGCVRTISSCQGSAVCPRGHINAKELSSEIDKTFFASPTPGKFKIAVTGCFRSCAKPQQNDLGFEGTVYPVLDSTLCTGCLACSMACPTKSIAVYGGVVEIERKTCIGCGECIAVCRHRAWKPKEKGVRVWVGGRVGKKPKMGEVYFEFLSLHLVPVLIEASINFYRDNAEKGERFADTLQRVGEDAYLKHVIAKLDGK